ncbi:MAG: hypothetical protein WA117_05530 [Verrucomicrobiia bacterium]
MSNSVRDRPAGNAQTASKAKAGAWGIERPPSEMVAAIRRQQPTDDHPPLFNLAGLIVSGRLEISLRLWLLLTDRQGFVHPQRPLLEQSCHELESVPKCLLLKKCLSGRSAA